MCVVKSTDGTASAARSRLAMADRVLVMLAISFLLLVSTASASDCPVSERCCCPRGTHLVESCTDVKNATCNACSPHTYMDIENVYTECFDCDLTVKNGCYYECPPEGPPRLTCAPGTTDATPATTATRLSTITVPTNGSAVGSSAQPPPTNSTPSSSSPAHMTTSEQPSKSARGVSPGIIGVLIGKESVFYSRTYAEDVTSVTSGASQGPHSFNLVHVCLFVCVTPGAIPYLSRTLPAKTAGHNIFVCLCYRHAWRYPVPVPYHQEYGTIKRMSICEVYRGNAFRPIVL